LDELCDEGDHTADIDLSACRTRIYSLKITLTSLEVYTSNQSILIKSWTGWKVILPDGE